MTRFIHNTHSGWLGGGRNYVLKSNGFHISYNPQPSPDFTTFQADNNGDETALVKEDDYYILNGDFRKEYDELEPKGFDACYDFFLSKPDLKSSWSN